MRQIEQALAVDEAFNKAPLVQARAALERGDRDAGLQNLRRIGQADVDDLAFHAKLAVDLFGRGMLTESIEEFRQGLAINDNFADVRNPLGASLFAAGRVAEAVAESLEALAINPLYVEAQVNHGLVLERLGRADEAEQAFRAALDLDPDNAVAREHLRPAA